MMKKNLNVDAMILDLRNVQEDFLDRYEQIKLDCMIALTSPRVQTLLLLLIVFAMNVMIISIKERALYGIHLFLCNSLPPW